MGTYEACILSHSSLELLSSPKSQGGTPGLAVLSSCRRAARDMVPLFFYTYSGILGRNIAFIDISIFYICVLAAFCLARKLQASDQTSKLCPFICLFTLVMLFAFFLFTFAPLEIGLFAEP